MARINFIVTVPIETPGEDIIYLTGNHYELGNWDPCGVALNKTGACEYQIELELPEGMTLEYKITRGSWETVEVSENFNYIENRINYINYDEDLYIRVENWEDCYEKTGQNTLTGNFDIHRNFYSHYLDDTRTIMVYLPPGYNYEDNHYPVLYLHDGQNVFDASTSYGGVEWRVDETAERLIREGRIRKIIMVAIYNDRDRDDEYTHTYDPSEGTGGKVENYGNFIVKELKPFIDSNYRTINKPEETAIMGSSLGGLCSLYLSWKYKKVFSLAGVISPSLWWDDRDIIKQIQEDQNFEGPEKIWLDAGTREGEDEDNDGLCEMVENARNLGEILIEKGYELNKNLFYLEAHGADHSENAWSNRVEQILLALFGIRSK